MTDELRCTGVLKGDFGIQLAGHALYAKVDGGIQLITVRVGEQPAKPARRPTKSEREIRIVSIEGADLDALRTAPRLRIEVLTLLNGLKTFDLDVSGINEALYNIRVDCLAPKSTAAGKAGMPRQDQQRCSPEIIERLKSSGVTDSQIAAACPER